ncbi:MAG: ABC transporter substrate-binding protein [Candidatus Solibacter usitatus]|nr:ABC transporter substrate-binding protein [Candidatus Solibacter usitatus]
MSMPSGDANATRRSFLGMLAPAALRAQEPIPIGFFGPADAAHARGGSVYMGLALAMEDANRAGGYQGRPFRLISRWSDDPWRGGAAAAVRLVFDDRVCALIGGIDGATTHLAEQVIAKALVPLIDPASTDQTVNHAGVPWIFSLAPADPAIAACLVEVVRDSPFTLVAGTDHDSRNLAAEVIRAARRRRVFPALRIDIAPGTRRLPQGQDVEGACVLIAPPGETAAIAGALPGNALIAAGPSARSRICSACPGLVSPALRRPDAGLSARLFDRFRQQPDDFSLLAYDAARSLIEAVQASGPDRALIRQELAARFGPNGRKEQKVAL